MVEYNNYTVGGSSLKLSEEAYAEFKRISDEQGIKYKDDADMRIQANSLVSLVKTLQEGHFERESWKQRLKDEPKGFSLESKGRNCSFCKQTVWGDIWYDKNGLKCLGCQEAFDTKLFPQYVFADKKNEKHITPDLLAEVCNLSRQTIHGLIRSGRIKARTAKSGKTIILRRENPDVSDVLHEAIEKRRKYLQKKNENRELSDEELKNLTGFFDTLIQIDLEQKHKIKNSKESP